MEAENILDKTIDNGVVEDVHVAPIGEFYGSDSEGKPIPEKITVEALQTLADKMNSGDDVLCDVDHQSCRPGVDKDTSAAGWFTHFVVDPIKGLFAKLNLTKRGKELLENREYRYTSPTFMLDKDGVPVDMHSISLTNTPAFKGFINPIINSEATPVDIKQESITDMTKEELVELIKTTVTAMNSEPVEEKKEEKVETSVENACSEEEKKEEVKNEEIDVTKSIESDVKTETSSTEASKTEEHKEDDKVKEEVKNEETVEKTETSVEEEKPVEKKEEIIKEEALNSAPTITIGADISGKTEWCDLHGDAFWTWLKKHPQGK